MRLKNTLTEYGAISKIFHWLSAAVLIIQIPLGMYLVDMDFSEKRLTIENIHVAVGISIFYLTILRLIYKTFNPTPNLNNSIFPGQKIIAKLNHVFLYISILALYFLFENTDLIFSSTLSGTQTSFSAKAKYISASISFANR